MGENDSFELGSSPPLRAASPIIEKSLTPVRSVTPAVKRKTSPETAHQSVKEESAGETTIAVAKENSPVRKSASSKEGEDNVPFGISDVLSDVEEEEGVCDVKEAKKSDDEGCGSFESEDDKEDSKKAQSKAEESDEGIGKSDDNVSKDEEEAKVEEEEAPKENNIKSKILNIIQDAKAMDQKRNIRNYGRNFEFQGMKEALKPVLPNDRRPTKAKRLDSMWMNVTAAKQRYNDPPAPSLEELKSRQKKAAPTLEELKNKPKSNVPWTRKGNAQPVKKEILAEEKEVKEFESCRKTLKDNVKIESGEKNARNIQAVKKNETTAPVEKESKVEIEPSKTCEKEKSVDKEEEKTQIHAVEVVEIKKESSEKVLDTATTEKTSCNAESAKTEAEETEVKVKESDSKVKVSEVETAALPRRSVSPSNNCASESSSEVEWGTSDDEDDCKATSPVKERSPVTEKPLSKPEPVIAKEIPSLLLMSPMVRRRGETVSENSNCVSVSASIRLPPPPSFRPPPPPVSPPVPATKVKDLGLGKKKEESSEEEESEWEYETESEEE